LRSLFSSDRCFDSRSYRSKIERLTPTQLGFRILDWEVPTVTITGYVGDLHGDGFKIDGEIVSFEKTSGQSGLRLEFNGADVTEALIN